MTFSAGHGIPQSDIDKTFEYSKLFFDLPVSVKENHPFDLDTFAGWRGLQELSEVTGDCRAPLAEIPQAFRGLSDPSCRSCFCPVIQYAHICVNASEGVAPPCTVRALTTALASDDHLCIEACPYGSICNPTCSRRAHLSLSLQRLARLRGYCKAPYQSTVLAGTRLWEQFVAPIDRPGNPIAASKYPPNDLIPGFKQHVEVRQS